MTSLGDPVPAGNILLSDSLTPALLDGSYKLDVVQTLTDQSGDTVGTIQPASQAFAVGGPRFTLPGAEILTQFPPGGSTGSFGQYLPHVVLTQPQLPWERTIGATATAAAPPWLALLLLEPGELVGDNQGLQVLTVSDLLDSPAADTRVPAGLTVSSDEGAQQCSAITIAGSTFAAIVPTLNELPYLAHVRQVDVTGKALTNAPSLDTFAVVVGNRFPAPPDASAAAGGQQAIVHLVSLEGFADLLSGETPSAPAETNIMLVSLYSWTYTCLAEPTQTFASLAENLVETGTPPTPLPAASLLLTLPYTPSTATDAATVAAQKRLDSGYVPLGYHAQSGEDGFAWYRGPFAPVIPNAVAQPGALTTAAAAMIYDETHGVFDHSLAAAWQCGQSLALADQTYATTLMALRQQASDGVSNIMLYGDATTPSPQAAVAERLQAVFGSGVIRRLGQVAPPAARTPRARRPIAIGGAARRAALQQPAFRARLADTLPDTPQAAMVAAWLGKLQLLGGVPFNHLVPDATMLPAESIRFFYLDPNWIAALTAGALNIGIGTSVQAALQSVLTTQLETAAAAAALGARALSLNQTPPAPAADVVPSGLLIRSALVSGWPGLSVQATAQGAAVPLLRMDLLAPGVLLCLFYGLPDTVMLEEPHEGLQFGVDDDGQAAWRTLSGSTVSAQPGPQVYTLASPTGGVPPTQPVSIRAGGNRVLNLDSDPTGASSTPVDLIGILAAQSSVAKSAFGPADLALQMMQGPETVTFTLSSSGNSQ